MPRVASGMTRTLLTLAFALAASAPCLASAQDGAAPTRTETFDDGDLVTGDLESPLVDVIASRGRHARHTLIAPRAHYTPEMLRSVENL